MRLYAKFFIMILVGFVYITNSNGQNIDSLSLNQKANELFKLINENDFHEAAKLFHYPPSYSKNELEKDIAAVSKSLKLFSNEFGNFATIDTILGQQEIVHLSIGGGDIPYWSKYSRYLNMRYSVNFKIEGFGFLIIKYCNIKETLVIREVQYALPRFREGAAQKMQQVMMKLLQMHNQIKNEDSEIEI